MNYEDKKICDDNLSDVSGGLAKEDLAQVLALIGDKSISELVEMLRAKYPDVDSAIEAIEVDAQNISPLVMSLIQSIGEAKLVALL